MSNLARVWIISLSWRVEASFHSWRKRPISASSSSRRCLMVILYKTISPPKSPWDPSSYPLSLPPSLPSLPSGFAYPSGAFRRKASGLTGEVSHFSHTIIREHLVGLKPTRFYRRSLRSLGRSPIPLWPLGHPCISKGLAEQVFLRSLK